MLNSLENRIMKKTVAYFKNLNCHNMKLVSLMLCPYPQNAKSKRRNYKEPKERYHPYSSLIIYIELMLEDQRSN